MNKTKFIKCAIAIALIVIFFFSDSFGIQIDVSNMLGGLLC